jgi:aryl-alcohol dehydrogenase-like predicted oxidoreductase
LNWSNLSHKLGLGTWQLGGVNLIHGIPMGWDFMDEHTALGILQAAFTSGIQFVDTADSYGQGQAELYIGQAIRKHTKEADWDRSKIMICTKFGNRVLDDGTMVQDFSSEHLIRAVDASLARLSCDYLDILLFHSPPENFDWANYDRGPLDELVHVGKIKEYGVSSKSVYGAKSVMDAEFGTVIEVIFNALDRRAATVLGNHHNRKKYHVIGRVPLASGFLTDKVFLKDPSMFGGGYRSKIPERDIHWFIESANKLAFLKEMPGGLTINALAFCLQSDCIDVVIPGVKDLGQLNAHLKALDLHALSDDVINKIEDAIPTVPSWWLPA